MTSASFFHDDIIFDKETQMEALNYRLRYNKAVIARAAGPWQSPKTYGTYRTTMSLRGAKRRGNLLLKPLTILGV